MHNKTCYGSFNIKQPLGERNAGIQTLMSLNNKYYKNTLEKSLKNYNNFINQRKK